MTISMESSLYTSLEIETCDLPTDNRQHFSIPMDDRQGLTFYRQKSNGETSNNR